MDKDYTFPMVCHDFCGAIVITQYGDYDNEIYGSMGYYMSGWYSEQHGFFDHFKENVKMIWAILRGKKYYMYDVIFNKKQWEDFQKFIKDA
jgi:hypothetical protein